MFPSLIKNIVVAQRKSSPSIENPTHQLDQRKPPPKIHLTPESLKQALNCTIGGKNPGASASTDPLLIDKRTLARNSAHGKQLIELGWNHTEALEYWEWDPWHLLRGDGLIGLPLSAQFRDLVTWHESQNARLQGIIALLRMERLAERLSTRFTAVGMLAVLAREACELLLSLMLTPEIGPDPEQPRPPPPSPVVSLFGLFVPRC